MLGAVFSLGLPQLDVLTKSELTPSDASVTTDLKAKSSSCPSEVKGILYNHIPKTGGTVVEHLMEAIFLSSHDPSTNGTYEYQRDDRGSTPPGNLKDDVPHFVYQRDQLKDSSGNPAPIEAADGKKYFVVGLVRRPCDYVLSQWVEKSNEQLKAQSNAATWWGKSSKMDSTDDKAKFHMFVENMLNQTSGGNTESLTLEEAPFMSVGTRVRGYDSASDAGNMHCVMRTDQLEADFKKCIQQYQSCGGVVDPARFTDEVIKDAIAQSTQDEGSAGRSVGDHASCDSMFDSSMQSAMNKLEKPIINKYKLGSCCS